MSNRSLITITGVETVSLTVGDDGGTPILQYETENGYQTLGDLQDNDVTPDDFVTMTIANSTGDGGSVLFGLEHESTGPRSNLQLQPCGDWKLQLSAPGATTITDQTITGDSGSTEQKIQLAQVGSTVQFQYFDGEDWQPLPSSSPLTAGTFVFENNSTSTNMQVTTNQCDIPDSQTGQIGVSSANSGDAKTLILTIAYSGEGRHEDDPTFRIVSKQTGEGS